MNITETVTKRQALVFNTAQKIVGDNNTMDKKCLTEEQLVLASEFQTESSVSITKGISTLRFVFKDNSTLTHYLVKPEIKKDVSTS